jgi:tetratricopeptide (TPR) repeat protein
MTCRFALAAAATTLAPADTITLKSGKSVDGSFYRQGDKYVIEPYHGTAFSVPVGDVVGIVLAPNPNSKQARGHQWNLLRYRISRSGSLPKIIGMLKSFIAANPHSASLSEAQRELIQYRQYRKLHLIKLGTRWISPAELAAIRKKVHQDLRIAVLLYNRGRLQQSVLKAEVATRLLPSSADAWIVKGVIEDRLNRLQAARRDFTTARRFAPHDVTALNNAAIVNFKLHRQPRSLLLFSRALTIDSGNRQILDNIYATLRAYKGDRRAVLFTNLRRSYSAAVREMETQMARHGLYRVGGSWVSARAYRKLKVKLTAYEQKKQALQADYDSTVLALKSVMAQIRQLDTQIVNIQNAIGALQVQQVVTAYQSGYYDYGTQAALSMNMANLAHAQRQKMKLENQRIAILAGLASIRGQARALQKSGPGIALNGSQILLFPEKFQPMPEPLSIKPQPSAGVGTPFGKPPKP